MNPKIIYFLLKLTISAILVALIVWKFDLGGTFGRLAEISFSYIFLSLIVWIILIFNNTLRWHIVNIAIGANLGFWKCFRLFFIGVFFNQTLPSSIGGDAVRMYMARKEGLPLSAAINGVMLERVATVSGLILLVILTQPVLLDRIGDHPAKYIFPGLAILAVVGICGLLVLDRFSIHLKTIPIIRNISKLTADSRKLFTAPLPAIFSITLGVSGTILVAFMTFLLGKSLSINLLLLDCLVLMPPVILVTTIPISIAGWGVREGAMVTAFSFVGVLEADAFLVSILFGLVVIVFSLPGGLAWLLGGYKSNELSKELSQNQ